MAATIKVANHMPRAVQIAPGVVLAGATGTQPGITENIDAEAFAKWRELMGESIDESAIYEQKGEDDVMAGKAVIAGAGGIADKPSTNAPGVSEPAPADKHAPAAIGASGPAPSAGAASATGVSAPAAAPAAKAQPAPAKPAA